MIDVAERRGQVDVSGKSNDISHHKTVIGQNLCQTTLNDPAVLTVKCGHRNAAIGVYWIARQPCGCRIGHGPKFRPIRVDLDER